MDFPATATKFTHNLSCITYRLNNYRMAFFTFRFFIYFFVVVVATAHFHALSISLFSLKGLDTLTPASFFSISLFCFFFPLLSRFSFSLISLLCIFFAVTSFLLGLPFTAYFVYWFSVGLPCSALVDRHLIPLTIGFWSVNLVKYLYQEIRKKRMPRLFISARQSTVLCCFVEFFI